MTINLGNGLTCTMKELDDALRRSYKHRPASESDRACVLIAWAAGEVSEGNAANLLDVDRVAARIQLQRAIERGRAMARRDVRAAIEEARTTEGERPA